MRQVKTILKVKIKLKLIPLSLNQEITFIRKQSFR